jgi:hypothetical protein
MDNMSVHKKLMEARVKLHSMELKKSGENKFAGYRYFELGDFIPQTMQIFNDLGLCSVISFDTDYATMLITDVEDGTVIAIKSPMAEASLKGAHPIQNLGAAESYQRRYLWLNAMEITESDVIDASPRPESKPVAKPVEKVEKPRPPAEIEGAVGSWSIKTTLSPEGSVDNWLVVVNDAVLAGLAMANKEDDVMQIFKQNKQLFDSIKAADAEYFKDLMAKFTETKNKLKGN